MTEFGILAKDPLVSGTYVEVSSFSQELLLLLIQKFLVMN